MTLKINFTNYHLQSDWQDASINEKIWLHSINIKNNNHNDDDLKKNYDLKIINESDIIIDNDKKNDDNDFIIEDYSKKCLAINDVKSNVTHRFIAPVRVFQSIHQKSIISLDVAPTGIAVSSSTDGTMKIWDTCTNVLKYELKGHYLDVNRCRFFPSNEVIVSVGLDMLIKIWSAIDGSCPVTMKGHTGSINDLAIVDRGRNIITVGRDGLAKLWSCAKQTCIENLFDTENIPINACAIKSFSNSYDLGQRKDSANDDISRSPVLSMISVRRPFNGFVVSHQDGSVDFHYDNHNQLLHLTGSDCDPIYQIVYDDKFIYTACRDGKVRKYYLNNAFE
uniref:Proteasomal ATPase-associated factor 1-like n=1 Tax=Dermatophagoides pteronyssinus TaxID=6956 RepID=A0A6P6YK67_DERPT|nr:proteasomal ATPase-associated factor 1-like [Dermatophagoides pteronyssinus]